MIAPVQLTDSPLISAWLIFDQAQLQVLSGRVELGQGNLTAILQIAADELDLRVNQVTITGGDTRATPNEGFTSGSLSIAQSGMAIRWAASAARNALFAVAAQRLSFSVDRLSVVGGQFFVDANAADLTYWDVIADVDWDQDVSLLASPKLAAARQVSGLSVPRIDLTQRIMGTPFVHDLHLPELVHGRVVQPPCLGAILQHLDENSLGNRPGVLGVWRSGEVVGLIADTAHHANSACDWAHLKAQWSLPDNAPVDPIGEIKDSLEEVSLIYSAGDIDQASGEVTAHLVSRPYLSHGSIGPSAAVAFMEEKHLNVWSHAQGPYPLRDALAVVLGMSAQSIDVIHHPGAGCYGHNGADDVALDAALLAKAFPGRPIKVVWSRADEFRCSPLAPGMVTRVSARVDQTHTIQAMDVLVNSAPHGNRPGRNGSPNLRSAAFLETPFLPNRSSDIPLAGGGGADRNAIPLYAIPNVLVRKRIVHNLPYRTSSMRGLGAHLNVYAIETLMEKLASEASEDPFDFRLRHLTDARAKGVLQELRTMSEHLRSVAAEDGEGWGIGFAKYKNTAAYCAIFVRVQIQERVRVTHAFAVLDGGEIINPDGAINQTEGGMLQALSWTLHEAIKFDGPAVATDAWLDYPILSFSDVPAVEVRLMVQPDAPPLGCAEAAQGPMAAAIGNAVFNAIGVHVCEMPITHDALVKAALGE
jgi:nicotinate dehydrogenase subunit B